MSHPYPSSSSSSSLAPFSSSPQRPTGDSSSEPSYPFVSMSSSYPASGSSGSSSPVPAAGPSATGSSSLIPQQQLSAVPSQPINLHPRIPASPPTPAPSPRPRVRTGTAQPPSRSNHASFSSSTGTGVRQAPADLTPDNSLDLDIDDITPDQSISSEYEDAISSSLLLTNTSGGRASQQHPQQWHLDAQSLTRAATLLLPTLPSSSRVTLLSDLLMLLSSQELAQISSFVTSKLRVDFLSDLPIEVSLHVLSFIDDPLTLARASQVCRFWRSLVNDEHTWEAMCLKYSYSYSRPIRDSQSPDTPTSNADLLASLYRRYRQRGLDPSNARNELRTLHDLFLAKQQHQSPEALGTAPRPDPEMSAADLRFYEQLEQIVQEESRERYGAGQQLRIQQDLAAMASQREPHLGSPNSTRTPVIAPSNIPGAPVPSSSSNPPAGSLSSHIGWLSTGSPTTRFPRTPPANRSRLPPLTGIAARSAFEPNARHFQQQQQRPQLTPSRTRSALPAHQPPGVNNPGPLSSWTGGLGLPWGLSDLITLPSLPSSLTGAAAANARMPPAPPVISGRGPSPAHSRPSALGIGLPSDASSSGGPSSQRAATFAGTKNQRFMSGTGDAAQGPSSSAKAHFKRNYLTESNWHRGGRLLTHHVSSENGAVCTCTAMDQRWLIIGMANGRIHVFDARTGLYERTLGRGGNDSGVWCLALVSKTKGVRSSTKGKGKAKATSTTPTHKYFTQPADGDRHGQMEYVTAEHQIRLVDYDPRLADAIESKTANTEASQTGSASGSPWFPMTRRAIQRGVGSARRAASSLRGGEAPTTPITGTTTATATGTTTNSAGETDSGPELIGGYPRDVVEAGPEFIRESILSSAAREDLSAEDRARQQGTAQEVFDALTRIRAEHGITGKRTIARPGRSQPHEEGGDEAMDEEQDAGPSASANASGSGDAGIDVPMDDAQDEVQFEENAADVDQNDDDEYDDCDSDSDEDSYKGFSMGIGGSANGLGTLCGATRGYGNESAILVSGGCDREVKVWNVSTGELKHTMRGHASTVRCLRVLEGRPIAVSGGRDSTVRVWNLETGQLVRILAGHQNSVRCLEVAGNQVATGSYDCTCRIWDVDTGECLHVLRGHYNQIYCVAFDGNKVATGSLDSTVRIWSSSTGEPLALLQGHTALVGTLQLSKNILISGGSDGRILVYSLYDMSLLYAICAHDNSVSCFQFDEHFIVTGGNDGAVRLWNLYDGSFIRELTRQMQSVWKLAFRDDKVLAMCKRSDESLSMEVIDFRPVE